ncbi:nucleotidyltransferase substrate binding protein [Aquiflexum sp.]|uniref:nucleotidyltransferase substrate binding protein n=1 Tax=Aquiflexum sp. TaxID=1872584 RepID=UPI003592EA09
MKILPPTCEKCFEDFQQALEETREVIRSFKNNPNDSKAQHKVVRTFELTHELALKTISEFFRKQGRPPFSGPRDVTVEAFNEDLIDNGKGWLDIIIERIKFTPLYPEDYEAEFSQNIIKRHILLLENFERKMTEKLNN